MVCQPSWGRADSPEASGSVKSGSALVIPNPVFLDPFRGNNNAQLIESKCERQQRTSASTGGLSGSCSMGTGGDAACCMNCFARAAAGVWFKSAIAVPRRVLRSLQVPPVSTATPALSRRRASARRRNRPYANAMPRSPFVQLLLHECLLKALELVLQRADVWSSCGYSCAGHRRGTPVLA